MCSDVLKGTVVVSKGLGALFRPASLLINFPLFPSKDNNNFVLAENGEEGDKILSNQF